MPGLRLLNLCFCAYGWLYIELMDLELVCCICAFEGCGRRYDLKLFARAACVLTVNYSPPHSQFVSDTCVQYEPSSLSLWYQQVQCILWRRQLQNPTVYIYNISANPPLNLPSSETKNTPPSTSKNPHLPHP